MRPTLLRILLDQPLAFWTTDAQTGLPGVGVGVVVMLLAVGWLLTQAFVVRGRPPRDEIWATLFFIGGVLIASSVARSRGVSSIPVFGYGFTVMLGVLAALYLAIRRAKSVGLDPQYLHDCAIWIVIPGVIGGRFAYLAQHGGRVFKPEMTLPQLLFATINLTEGGLVLIGALVGGFVGVYLFARYHKFPVLWLLDLIIPSVFVGIGFGRIGCLLNGCCYGEPCTYPWGIRFPADSGPFLHYLSKGMLTVEDTLTMPLHPTQIYSSIDGFVLAAITTWFFYKRRHEGEVFALACVLYSMTRFTLEFLRDDEQGQFGTPLAISQFYALGIFAAGAALWVRIAMRGTAVRTFGELGIKS